MTRPMTAREQRQAEAAAKAADRVLRREALLGQRDALTGGNRREEARARRRANQAPLTGWVTITGQAITPGPNGITLDKGDVITQDPTDSNGLVHPVHEVTPGQSYVAGVTVTTNTYVGLQWIRTDSTPGEIVWENGARERVSVTAIAPPDTRGVRMLLGMLATPAESASRDPETRAILTSMRQFRKAGS